MISYRAGIRGPESESKIPRPGCVRHRDHGFRKTVSGPVPGLGRPGGVLLFHALRRSTIGAEGFHFRVRDGVGWFPLAMATRPAKPGNPGTGDRCPRDTGSDWSPRMTDSNAAGAARIQADRAISTGKLHALPHFHTRPIDVVVSHGSQGRTRFKAGFPLRCFQRLSLPYLATRLCRWRDNRSTRGTSTPVLSY